MIVGQVIKSMEKIDMSLSQCKQIRELFLVNARQHLLHAEATDDRPCYDGGRNRFAPSPGDTSPRRGRDED